jgi:hypothetical protein
VRWQGDVRRGAALVVHPGVDGEDVGGAWYGVTDGGVVDTERDREPVPVRDALVDQVSVAEAHDLGVRPVEPRMASAQSGEQLAQPVRFPAGRIPSRGALRRERQADRVVAAGPVLLDCPPRPLVAVVRAGVPPIVSTTASAWAGCRASDSWLAMRATSWLPTNVSGTKLSR